MAPPDIVRCPRCLTDTSLPSGVDHLACPVCGTTLRRPRAGHRRVPTGLVVVAVLTVAAVVAVVGVRHLDAPHHVDPVHQVVSDELDADASNAAQACDSLHGFASTRPALVHLLDSFPVAARERLTTALKQEASSWLPAAAAGWHFAQLRDALLFLWDECGRRGLGT